MEMQCFRIQYLGRMYAEQRVKDRAQILLGLCRLHWLGKPSQGHIEEFLHDLVADNALLRCQCLADELRGFLGSHRGALVERIDEGVRFQGNLSLVQFIPAEAMAGSNVVQTLHHSVERWGVSRASGEVRKPFAEYAIECFALARAKRNVLHTRIACTVFV